MDKRLPFSQAQSLGETSGGHDEWGAKDEMQTSLPFPRAGAKREKDWEHFASIANSRPFLKV